MFSWTGSYFLLNIYSESKKINFNYLILLYFKLVIIIIQEVILCLLVQL